MSGRLVRLLAGASVVGALHATLNTALPGGPRVGAGAPLLALGWMTLGGALAHAGWLGLPGSAAWGVVLALPVLAAALLRMRR